MKLRQKLEITAGHRNIKDGDQATRITYALTLEAVKGEAVVGSIQQSFDGAAAAIVKTLDRRPY